MRWIAFVTAAFCSTLTGQGTLHVGPGGFRQIQPAIDAAAPGDIVEIASGTYDEFACGKRVHLVAQPGARVTVRASQVRSSVSSVLFQVPPGETATVTGIDFRSLSAFQVLTTRVLSGVVAFEQCTFSGSLRVPELVLVLNSAVWFRGCTLSVGTTAFSNAALRADQATITAVDSVFEGSDLSPDGFVGAGDGIHATDCFVHLVGCTARGGSISFSAYPGGDGIEIVRGKGTWLADTTLSGGSGGLSWGGHGLNNLGNAVVRLARVTATGGAGSLPGSPTSGNTLAESLVGLGSVTGPVTMGATYAVDFLVSANTPLILAVSFALEPTQPLISAETTWLPDPTRPGSAAGLYGIVVADAAGVARFRAVIPNLPSLRHRPVWFHGFSQPSGVLRAAPPIGGVIR